MSSSPRNEHDFLREMKSCTQFYQISGKSTFLNSLLGNDKTAIENTAVDRFDNDKTAIDFLLGTRDDR